MKLGEIITSAKDGACRLSMEVGGSPLWFESSDVDLVARPEAFASALMFASLKKHRRLDVCQPVSEQWLMGVKQLQAIWGEWWGYPMLEPKVNEFTADATEPACGRALCFTGGIDSMHSLIHGNQSITHLLYVEGYDVDLGEAGRLEDIRQSLRKIAQASDKKLLILKSNLRQHRAFRKVSWQHAHGSALVAAGYMLSGVVGELLIPSSYAHKLNYPWGSSSHTDHLWSTPFLKVVHDDASLYRFEKTQVLASEPLAQKHLRVCFQRRIDQLNCSVCEKCVRTMIALDASGLLENFETFDHITPLWKRIDAIPRIPPGLSMLYSNHLKDGNHGEAVTGAIERLIERTQQPPRRSLRRLLPRFLRPGGGQA